MKLLNKNYKLKVNKKRKKSNLKKVEWSKSNKKKKDKIKLNNLNRLKKEMRG